SNFRDIASRAATASRTLAPWQTIDGELGVSRLKSRPPRVKALKDSEELKLLGERGGLRQECPTKNGRFFMRKSWETYRKIHGKHAMIRVAEFLS
ncbi:unnamed protein product, partial [Cladocopium goreaui]